MSRESTRRGIMRITSTLLESAGIIPDGTIVLGAKYNASKDVIDLIVSHPNLPAVLEGCDAPVVLPMYLVDADTGISRCVWD